MYKYFIFAAVIIWLVLIFALSHQPATESSKLSREITEIIGFVVEKTGFETSNTEQLTNHQVRKSAHFFIFLVLGSLLMIAFNSFGVTGWKGMLASFVLCILFAISDETHQIFVDGRGAQVKDLKLDIAGASVGIVFVSVLLWARKWMKTTRFKG